MDKHKINKQVDETLDSMDGAERAMPAPYLLTRINARMGSRQQKLTSWEYISQLMSSPVAAFATIVFILIINLFIYTSNNSGSELSNIKNSAGLLDEYSMNNSSALYDLENLQP